MTAPEGCFDHSVCTPNIQDVDQPYAWIKFAFKEINYLPSFFCKYFIKWYINIRLDLKYRDYNWYYNLTFMCQNERSY